MEFKIISTASPETDRIIEIYDEAFPARERMMTMQQLVSYSEKSPRLSITAALDGDVLAGFYVLEQIEECYFILFFAVNAEVRGGGYGAKMLEHLLSQCQDKQVLGGIESPIKDAENYEQRVKRQRFFERNGMTMTDFVLDINGGTFNLITNRTKSEFIDKVDSVMSALDEIYHETLEE